MSRMFPLHKKALFFSAALSMSLFSLPLYACDFTDPSGAEHLSIKRPAEGEPSGPEQHRNKKLKTQKNDDDLSLNLAQETFLSEYNFFDAFPEDVIFNISSFLNPKDLNNLALSSKVFYTPARQALIHTDIRDLKNKEWVDGPKKGTFENYLFNSILWKMEHALLKSKIKKGRICIPDTGPLLKGYSYLEGQFKDIKPLQAILEGFVSPKKYGDSEKGKLMVTRATSHPGGGEDDFLSIINYIITDGEDYTLPKEGSVPMGLLERFHRVKKVLRKLENESFDLNQGTYLCEMLTTYDPNHNNHNECKKIADIYHDAANDTPFPQQKRAFFSIAARLYDKATDLLGEKATVDNVRWTAQAHYNAGLNSDDTAQGLMSFKSSAQLYDAVLDQLGTNTTISDLKDAAKAHYNAGLNSDNPAQELMSFNRSAQLHDAVLDQLGTDASISDLKNAAQAHYNVGADSCDPQQRLMSFKRSAQLYDAVLDQLGTDATAPLDLQDAAQAHYNVGINSEGLEQAFMSFVRATKLFDALFALNSIQPISVLEKAVNAYEFIGELYKAQEIRARIAILKAYQQPF